MGQCVCAWAPWSTVHPSEPPRHSQPVPQADSVVCASQAASATRYVDMEESWQSEEVVSAWHLAYGESVRKFDEVAPVPNVIT